MLGSGIAQGMMTTLWHFFFGKNVTLQYPEERLELPPWTRGRPRLIYDVDSGDLRCTACGACALACPVDVIKIEQHPAQGKGKILDRFDLDMGGCIECALCVEACPFRAIVMAPDFEFGDVRPREVAGLQHARAADRRHPRGRLGDGVHPGRQARAGRPVLVPPAPAGHRQPLVPVQPPGGPRQPPAREPLGRRPRLARAHDRPRRRAPGQRPRQRRLPRRHRPHRPRTAVGGGGPMTAAQQKAASVSGPLGFTSDLAGLKPEERAKIYKERAAAAGIGRPAPKE